MDDYTKIMDIVKSWQKKIRRKYIIPDEYEICIDYGPEGNISHVKKYMKQCEQQEKLLLKKNDESLWWFRDNKIGPAISRDQYIQNLNSGIKDSVELTQKDSDLFAHFIQIVGILQRSSWNKSPNSIQYNMNDDGMSRGNMPILEQTAFALVYVRQLISTQDCMFNKTCNQYKCFMDNQCKIEYVQEIQKRFNKYLKEKSSFIPLRQCVDNNQQLIDAFLYGALILHGSNNPKSKLEDRRRYQQMYVDKKYKDHYIFELNNTLKQIVSMASTIGILLQRDFSNWIQAGYIPKPDVFWQETMFSWLETVEKHNDNQSNGNKPVFGKAFNVEISTIESHLN